MLRVFVLVSLLLVTFFQLPLVAVASPASQRVQTPMVTQTLADLGYTSDITLRGPRAAVDMTFPLPEAGIANGTVTLKLTPSQILDPRSTVQVFLNDLPALSIGTDKIAQNGTLSIPVSTINQ